jgi:type II secretory ATPase GspE/PulE/Tfp pilus assembly ATPase PilB-like protein
MDDARAPLLDWKAFEALPSLERLDDAPPFLRLYAFSADRQADPALIEPALREAGAALITATSAAVLLLADEAFAPERAQQWSDSLRAHGHAVTRCLRTPGAVVRALYQRDAERRRVAAAAVASASEGAAQLRAVLAAALQRGASDVDIVVDEDAPTTVVRLRIHGGWTELERRPDAFGLDLMRAAFGAVRLDERMRGKAAWSPRADLAGVARWPELGDLQVRLQQMVERSGVGLTLRVLSHAALAGRHVSLADLGYPPAQARELSRALARASGLVLVVGATGSGKTTTLNLGVATSPRFADRKWVSIEDPPEIDTPGIFQIPVATAGAFGALEAGPEPFAEAMRKVLRFTPDGVIAGEVRDRASAQLAVQMALTGHVVAASLHASDAFIALARLAGRELGVDPLLLQEPGVVSLIVAQRLLPRLCRCALTVSAWRHDAAPEDAAAVRATLTVTAADAGSVRLRHPIGCAHCATGRAGYAGRIVCAQTVVFDADLAAAWREGGLEAARRLWRGRHGDPTLRQTVAEHAIARMKRGECDPRDVAGVLDTAHGACQAPTAKERGLPDAAALTDDAVTLRATTHTTRATS